MAKGFARNLKVTGSSPRSGTLNFSVLVLPPVPRLGYQKDRGCKFVFGFVHLKEHLGLFEKSRGLSPVPVFYLSSSSFHRRELTMAVYTALNNQSTNKNYKSYAIAPSRTKSHESLRNSLYC